MDKEIAKKKLKRKVTIELYDDNTLQVNAPKEFAVAMWILNEAQRAIIRQNLQNDLQEAQPNRIIRPEFKGITLGEN
jgi:hypothetical protein